MLKMGLVGLGKMGQYHLNLYDEIAAVEAVGVYDSDKARSDALAAKKNLTSFGSLEEMAHSVEAVTIAAPTKYHYEIAKFFLDAGVHTLVEKPITTDIREAEALFELAERKNLVLNIGHVERFNGAVQELKNIVEKPIVIEAKRVGPFNPSFKNDSIVLDLMIHDIDIALSLAGGKLEAVQAAGAPVYTKLCDYALVTLYFGKLSAHLFASRISQNKERVLSVIQEDALVVLDYTSQDINISRRGQSEQSVGDKEIKYRSESVQERLFVYKDNPLKLEIKHFTECVKGEAAPLVSHEHDLAALKTAIVIDKLLEKGHGEEAF